MQKVNAFDYAIDMCMQPKPTLEKRRRYGMLLTAYYACHTRLHQNRFLRLYVCFDCN